MVHGQKMIPPIRKLMNFQEGKFVISGYSDFSYQHSIRGQKKSQPEKISKPNIGECLMAVLNDFFMVLMPHDEEMKFSIPVHVPYAQDPRL